MVTFSSYLRNYLWFDFFLWLQPSALLLLLPLQSTQVGGFRIILPRAVWLCPWSAESIFSISIFLFNFWVVNCFRQATSWPVLRTFRKWLLLEVSNPGILDFEPAAMFCLFSLLGQEVAARLALPLVLWRRSVALWASGSLSVGKQQEQPIMSPGLK